MKKIIIAIGVILLACLGLAFWANRLEKTAVAGNGQNLIIYNWGDYLDPQLVKNLKSKLVIMWCMKLLIQMKRCIPRLSREEQLTI